jgi:hypothetical protein
MAERKSIHFLRKCAGAGAGQGTRERHRTTLQVLSPAVAPATELRSAFLRQEVASTDASSNDGPGGSISCLVLVESIVMI